MFLCSVEHRPEVRQVFIGDLHGQLAPALDREGGAALGLLPQGGGTGILYSVRGPPL